MTHEEAMRAAMIEAERARGSTGDNPWVGSVIVCDGAIVARGHTQGPGEDHAEIGALREARAHGVDLARCTLYSTLEPCAFHGRTPACAKVIAESGVRQVVVGIRDPHPRVDGAGIAIVRAAGIEVFEDVRGPAIRHQLAPWIFHHHRHEPLAYASEHLEIAEIMERYGVEVSVAEALINEARARARGPAT